MGQEGIELDLAVAQGLLGLLLLGHVAPAADDLERLAVRPAAELQLVVNPAVTAVAMLEAVALPELAGFMQLSLGLLHQ